MYNPKGKAIYKGSLGGYELWIYKKHIEGVFKELMQ
jgi:hypothetical protein